MVVTKPLRQPDQQIFRGVEMAGKLSMRIFGSLAEYTTVTMDAVENALELNRPSLIE